MRSTVEHRQNVQEMLDREWNRLLEEHPELAFYGGDHVTPDAACHAPRFQASCAGGGEGVDPHATARG